MPWNYRIIRDPADRTSLLAPLTAAPIALTVSKPRSADRNL